MNCLHSYVLEALDGCWLDTASNKTVTEEPLQVALLDLVDLGEIITNTIL